jgi:hypothetical protein
MVRFANWSEFKFLRAEWGISFFATMNFKFGNRVLREEKPCISMACASFWVLGAEAITIDVVFLTHRYT